MEHASENNPKKELLFALVGTVLFLGIVLLIAISAFLRPAGHHVAATPAVDADAATIDAEVVDTDAAEVPLTAAAQETTEVEADANPQEAVAEATDTDALAATPSTGNLRSDDVVVADGMSIGGEGAVDSNADAATSEAADSPATDSPANDGLETETETESATTETNDSPEEAEAIAQ